MPVYVCTMQAESELAFCRRVGGVLPPHVDSVLGCALRGRAPGASPARSLGRYRDEPLPTEKPHQVRPLDGAYGCGERTTL